MVLGLERHKEVNRLCVSGELAMSRTIQEPKEPDVAGFSWGDEIITQIKES